MSRTEKSLDFICQFMAVQPTTGNTRNKETKQGDHGIASLNFCGVSIRDGLVSKVEVCLSSIINWHGFNRIPKATVFVKQFDGLKTYQNNPPLNFLYQTGVAWGSYKSVFPYGFLTAPWGRKRSICSQAICFVENSVFQGHLGQLVVFSEFFNFLDKKTKNHFVEDLNFQKSIL